MDFLPSVRLGLPPSSLFKFPPDSNPQPLPPPVVEPSWTQPFNIPPTLYRNLLSAKVPLTVAATYATTVVLVNRINKKRGNKPWPISKTRAFSAFVILHNVFLAVYSLWTFLGMTKAFYESWPARSQRYGVVNVVDALCKINGPRGLGNAAIYDPQADAWTMTNPEFQLGEGMAPDPTDVGRLWNKGLAFFGWLFYLSKFYEVLDTAIILAKGKRSSTLQTYHHAGAMMCMWAGIRFMAAPIWIFALFNSLIHAMMYTYYTLTALGVRIPVRIKKSLTTMQIIQFIIGSSLAAVHLFIYYSAPVAVPHNVALGPLATATSKIASVAAATASATASAGVGPWLKKLALRAAGAEGVAENVVNSNGSLFGADGVHATEATLGKREVRYTIEPRTFTCMDTTGQAFAVWLNVLYLLPLTFLFARFFVRSYLRRADPSGKQPTHSHTSEKAGMDALKGVTREITKAVIEMHGDGVVSDNESGTSTPHPEAYEASVDGIMTPKQHRADKKAASVEKQPAGVKAAATGNSSSGTKTPVDITAYEANIKDVMTSKQQAIEEEIHHAARRPSHVQSLPTSKKGIRTPLDERAYEANIEDAMTVPQRNIDQNPEQWMRDDDTNTPEKGYEVTFDSMLNRRERNAQRRMQPNM